MSNARRAYVKKTSTMVAIFNEYDEIDELRLKGQSYEGFGVFVPIPISCLENVHLNEIPEDVGISPVQNVEQSHITLLDFPTPLMYEVVVYSAFATIHLHGYTKYWTEILGLRHYMDILALSITRLQHDNPTIVFHESTSQEDVHFFLDFDILLDLTLTFPQAIDRIQAVFTLINNSLEEVMSSLRVFIKKPYTDIEQNIRGKWRESMSLTTSHEKGISLEELLVLIFSSIQGFIPSHRVRTQTEEIDISVRNESRDPFWSKFTPFILVECKNWSTSCGKNEVVLFREKLTNRVGYSKVGFLISMNGFTTTVTKEILRGSQGDYLIVPIDGNNLKELVFSMDRNTLLKKFVEKSVFT